MFNPETQQAVARQPQKQGRMFHLELGQNDGPFKPSTRKLESTEMKKLKQSRPSDEGVLQLQHSSGAFKQADDVLKEESAHSVSKQIAAIEDAIMKGQQYLEEYKSEASSTRKEVQDLLDQLISRNESVLSQIKPGIVESYQSLKQRIKEQKDENEQLHKNWLTLKKENATTQQKINICNNRIEKLEETLGLAHHHDVDPDDDIDADPALEF